MQRHIKRATYLVPFVSRAMQAAVMIALSADRTADPGSLSPPSSPCTLIQHGVRVEREETFQPQISRNHHQLQLLFYLQGLLPCKTAQRLRDRGPHQYQQIKQCLRRNHDHLY